jgi:hypothetical protein
LLLAAAALVLLAVAAALPRPGRSPEARMVRRWAPSVALLLIAAAAAAVWTGWQPTAPPPVAAAAATDIPVYARVPPGTRPPPAPVLLAGVTLDAVTAPDRKLVRLAANLLDRHGELASHRPDELGRRLSEGASLNLTACEFCTTGSLAKGSYAQPSGGECVATLNTPVIRRQAGQASVPASELTALAILHKQEGCLRHNGGTLAPFTPNGDSRASSAASACSTSSTPRSPPADGTGGPSSRPLPSSVARANSPSSAASMWARSISRSAAPA